MMIWYCISQNVYQINNIQINLNYFIRVKTKMRNKVLSLMLAFTATLPISSFAFDDKPFCPSIDAVKKAGLNFASPFLGGWFVMNLKNTFDTDRDWAFLLVVGDAQDEADAIKKGNAIVSLSTYAMGPFFNERDKAWGCGYIYINKNVEVRSMATTASIDWPEQVRSVKAAWWS